MSMNVAINGSLSITNFTDKDTVSFNQAYNTIGNNLIKQSMLLPTGSWQLLPTGSNVDFNIGTFTDNDLTSSIMIALGNTGSFASILTPGDTCLLTYNQNVKVWAFASGSNPLVQLNYTLVSYK